MAHALEAVDIFGKHL